MNDKRSQYVQSLIKTLKRDFRETAGSTGIEAPDERVLEAIRKVPRDRFVPDRDMGMAWENTALSIGYGQTISQPFVVALMTQLLELTPESRVLEIGTGSGYQTALLGELAGEVYSIEVVPELAAQAETRLRELGYDNIRVRSGNGRRGWPDAAPFDAVIVTAAAEDIPPALVEQLRPGGRIVIPVDTGWYGQDLLLGIRTEDGQLDTRSVLPVVFVPLVGKEGGK
ncbi:protein-L-isoaspartate O-methyltransferase [Thioalkalivibrio denitrificans]|uniref:Protein-L-isoaspartate O-methyltransferase n=1 Tax=Thioalkalivibrio denitrificans TaxID=108003 RepID=A0A1V3NGZ1_9GAMM|nr:protein-L-isoaspartate(D-aspartate) O-methyltransferase [Thioalkalivibrio denitrificans]OOG24148.1 protein-L-isoaspartate O-methyltransferase [Thioalkalivibrio denitrificans]